VTRTPPITKLIRGPGAGLLKKACGSTNSRSLYFSAAVVPSRCRRGIMMGNGTSRKGYTGRWTVERS